MCVCVGGGAWVVAKCCTRQQNYVLIVHANRQSGNMIVNQCGAGRGGFEGAGSWAMENQGKGGGGGAVGGLGGGVKLYLACKHNLLQYSSILCMVRIC